MNLLNWILAYTGLFVTIFGILALFFPSLARFINVPGVNSTSLKAIICMIVGIILTIIGIIIYIPMR